MFLHPIPLGARIDDYLGVGEKLSCYPIFSTPGDECVSGKTH